MKVDSIYRDSATGVRQERGHADLSFLEGPEFIYVFCSILYSPIFTYESRFEPKKITPLDSNPE